jgi:hypothetical protein
MISRDQPLLVGAVEQAICGGDEPVCPPISVSLNGSLAKWRDKFQALDIRVNDPGLKKYSGNLEQLLTKTQELGIEAVITLPETIPFFFKPPYDLVPAPPSTLPPGVRPRKKSTDFKPVVAFQFCYFGIARSAPDPKSYRPLTTDECTPILAMAAKHQVRKVIVPVSEPGLFLDPQAGEEFTEKFRLIAKQAQALGITLYLRNGGLAKDFFLRLHKETGCRLAYNIGIAHREREDFQQFYETFPHSIDLLFLQQTLPGLDKFAAHRENLLRMVLGYRARQTKYQALEKDGTDKPALEDAGNQLFTAYREFREARENDFSYLGLFQNGDINLIPFLRRLKQDLQNGSQKIVFLETAPNLKNMDILSQYLVPNGFQAKI